LEINGIQGSVPKAVWGGESKDEAQLTGALLSSLIQAGIRVTDEGIETLSERVGLPLERDQQPTVPARRGMPFNAEQRLSLLTADPVVVAVDKANDEIARNGAADLSQAFRGALAPIRRMIEESKSAEDLQTQILSSYPDWSSGRVVSLIESALVAYAANRSAVS
jgi:hypothetical protein